MKKTILLTGARAPVTLDLARALKRAGHRVIGVESMVFPLSKNSRGFHKFYTVTAPNTSLKDFKNDLERIIREEKVNLLIPTCEEAFHVAKVKAELPCEVLVDSFELLDKLHSKLEFNALCKELDLRAPQSFRVTEFKEAEKVIKSLKWEEFVLKPEFSRFAAKTRILNLADSLSFLKSSSLQNGTAWVIQRCLKGPEYCTYSLAKNGKLLAHVTYDHEFTAGRGAGICFRAVENPKIEAWVKSFVEKTGFTGQFAFDFIELADGNVEPLECNPRATSGLHLIANHPDFIEALTSSMPTKKIVRPKPGAEGQLRLAMLVYGLPSVRSSRRMLQWLKTFVGAREVVFSLKDPRPFVDQFFTFFALVAASRRLKITPLEVSTRDIEWNGVQK
jgi:predicted ATP-grasp superfamily ATP-dependent carboligase